MKSNKDKNKNFKFRFSNYKTNYKKIDKKKSITKNSFSLSVELINNFKKSSKKFRELI